jgi:signal transduction histidine kinase
MLQLVMSLGNHVIDTGQPALWTGEKIVNLAGLETYEPGVPLFAPLAPGGGRTLGVPLKLQPDAAGSLVMCVGKESAPFTQQDYSFISTIGGQLGIALQNARLYQEVEAREKLRADFLHRVVNAQEQERQRIARELHDGTGQTLTALGLGLAATVARLDADQPQVARQIGDLKQLSVTALEEIYQIVADLRPSVLDDLGLVPALRGQTQGFEARSGVRTDFTVQGDRRRLQPEVETIVFRIAQEALSNVAKHAAASNAWVSLLFGDETVELVVRDNGQGFEPEKALSARSDGRRPWGLAGMLERAALAGGTCEFSSSPGRGATVRVCIPVKELPEKADAAD